MIETILMFAYLVGVSWLIALSFYRRNRKQAECLKGLLESFNDILKDENESFLKLTDEFANQRKDMLYIIGLLEYLKPLLMSVNINSMQEALEHFVKEEDYETAEVIRKQLKMNKEALSSLLKQAGKPHENN